MNSPCCRCAKPPCTSGLRLAHHLREQTQGKLFADDGQDLQQGLVVRRQPIYARRQDTLHRRRQLYGRQGPGQGDPGDLVPDGALPTSKTPCSTRAWTNSSMKKGLPSVRVQDELFERLPGSGHGPEGR